ncbi:MAG: ferredoxin family protein [Methanosarcinaceae archaeon]|nr:ferredoxin family protein [Methanosarcinaceae archaeon]
MPPKVDLNECEGVGACVEACPMDVFDLINDRAVVARPEECAECGACVDACPMLAITLP